MAHAIFYMHQSKGASAGVCLCNHTYQMEKTTIMNYRNYPSILKLGEVCNSRNATNFSFSMV